MAMSPAKITSEQEDQMFRLLRQLDISSDGSQRVTAAAIGVSLGRLNALLKQATDAKLVKITDRNGPDKRARLAMRSPLVVQLKRTGSPINSWRVNFLNTTRFTPN